MVEHLFLCGLSDDQRSRIEGGTDLRLHGQRANVRLRLEDVRDPLLSNEPELLTDLAEIATYVFAADCSVRRGGAVLSNMGEAWRRAFRLVIAVRCPGLWREPERLKALRNTLEFLSEDTWHFDFVDIVDPPSLKSYLDLVDTNVENSGGTTVMLFSGGLDSFAGAVRELNSSNRHVVLVSRKLPGMTQERQRKLAKELKKRYPRRVTHIAVNAGLTKETEAREHTQRTRSFLFSAIAMVAAIIEKSDRVRFYENGIMSANLPIAMQVVGARSSRSTHPRSLMLLSRFCRQIWPDEIVIDNPFVWMTKVEVIRELMAREERQYIRYTLSCSETRNLTVYKTHCGECAQCIQRRISTLGAEAADCDPGEAYKVDLLTGARHEGEVRQMAIDMVRSAIDFRALTEDGFAIKYANELGWLTSGFPDLPAAHVARKFAAMCKRHGNAVRDIFVRATEQHSAALFDKKLPASSLLRIWYETGSPVVETTYAAPTPSNVAVPPNTSDESEVRPLEIIMALDQRRQEIRIDGIARIGGATNFRVMSILVDLHRADRASELLPENYRTLRPDELATQASSGGEVAGRQAVSRLRKKIEKEFADLYPEGLERDAIIENVHGKGYRLNPRVRIVDIGEMDQQSSGR